jgi:hypothetical protein
MLASRIFNYRMKYFMILVATHLLIVFSVTCPSPWNFKKKKMGFFGLITNLDTGQNNS